MIGDKCVKGWGKKTLTVSSFKPKGKVTQKLSIKTVLRKIIYTANTTWREREREKPAGVLNRGSLTEYNFFNEMVYKLISTSSLH